MLGRKEFEENNIQLNKSFLNISGTGMGLFTKANSRAPGKLILSGDHSAARGTPALVLAVNYFVEAKLEKLKSPDQFEFIFSNFNKTIVCTKEYLNELFIQTNMRYQDFLKKKLSISKVLHQPTDLALYTVAKFLNKHPIDNLGLKITLDSDIPIGCGLGSSAATIVSLFTLFKILIPSLDEPNYLQTLKEIESMQHGVSIGLDLMTSNLGGCHYVQDGKASPRVFPKFPLYLVNTGARKSSSGAAIGKVSEAWQNNNLLPAFNIVVNKMDDAIKEQNQTGFCESMTENHYLLCKLGIVPEKVADFIQKLIQNGFAAKISGAGATEGNEAGVLIISGSGDPKPICREFGYEVNELKDAAPGPTCSMNR